MYVGLEFGDLDTQYSHSIQPTTGLGLTGLYKGYYRNMYEGPEFRAFRVSGSRSRSGGFNGCVGGTPATSTLCKMLELLLLSSWAFRLCDP